MPDLRRKPATTFAAMLAGPICWALLTSASAAPLFGDVPFDLVRNSVLAKMTLRGQQPCNVLLDTGADPSIIDLATAKSIGMRMSSSGFQGDGGGSQTNIGYPTVLRDFDLGSMHIAQVAAVALDLSAPSHGLGQPLCGVLGYSLMQGQIVQFDYHNQVVRFLSHFEVPRANAIVLHFHYNGDLLVKGLKVNGHPVVANFDTGSNGNFQLTAKAAQRLALQAEVDAAVPSESTGFNGKTSNRSGHIAEISVGSEVIESPEVIFYGAQTGRDRVGWDVRVGNAFLKNYRVTFDFTKHLITLERPGSDTKP